MSVNMVEVIECWCLITLLCDVDSFINSNTFQLSYSVVKLAGFVYVFFDYQH